MIGGLAGQAHAATYYMLGAYSYLIELWGSPVSMADINNDGAVSDEEYMKWIDLDLTGDGWINPHKFQHPDLGEIWIGGTAKKHMQRTPPSRFIEMEADKNIHFILYCVSQFPKVAIDEISVKAISSNIYQVDVTVGNDRVYPTASDRAVQLKRNIPDKLVFRGSDNVKLIETSGEAIGGQQRGFGGGRRGGSQPESQMADGNNTEFRLEGKSKRIIRYIVAMDGKKGWAEFGLTSKTGGNDTKRIELVVE